SGGALTSAQQAALAAASGLLLSETDSTGSGAGSIIFSYSAADKTFNFLAVGQTLTITYDVTVTDNNGLSSTQPVTITVIGTNEAPVITSAAQTGAVTEGTNIDNSGNLNAGGTITFTDVNLADTHTVTFSAGGNNYLGTFAPLLTHDATGGSTGNVGGNFPGPGQGVDLLAAGQTPNQTYTVKVDDNNGGLTTQDVTITITGINEAPVIGVAQLTGSVTEDLQGQETGSETTSGTIAFTDADPTDVHLVSAAFKSTDYALGQLGSLTAVKTTDTTGSGTGGLLTWHFTATDAALSQLAKGQIVHETYTITLALHNAGVITRDVTVTITGTDDAPVIGVAQLTGSVTEGAQGTGSETTSGTIAFTDADLTDVQIGRASCRGREYEPGELGSVNGGRARDVTGQGAARSVG